MNKRITKFDLCGLKEMRDSYFCVTPKNHRNVCLMKILKSTVHKKSNCVFLSLGEENFEKQQLLQTSIMVLFEIQQRFKGHFFTELCVSFNDFQDSNSGHINDSL